MSPSWVSPRRARSAFTALSAVGALIVFAPSALAGTDSIRFEFGDNGTWTVPDRVSEIEVEVAGAGGGGNSAPGGNGALVRALIEVVGGTTFTVGVGGGGESTNASQSGGGGASILESGDILIIAGGGGGATSWSNAIGGNAGHNTTTGGGQKGGNSTGGGNPGANGTGGILSNATNGENYNPGNGLLGQGGQSGRRAVVGGAGGEARNDSLGGGGGAGFGGGSSGKEAISNLRGGGGGGGSVARGTGVGFVDGTTSYYSSLGGAGGLSRNDPGGDGWVVITWVIPPPLPSNATEEVFTAEPIEITLAMPAGLTCSAPQSDGSGGWVRLPAGDDCTGENSARSTDAGVDADLLGWATTADFPVDIAQRQVDNGWGAYELTYASGELSAVFIPGGGWTNISGDTNLFPIWAQD